MIFWFPVRLIGDLAILKALSGPETEGVKKIVIKIVYLKSPLKLNCI